MAGSFLWTALGARLQVVGASEGKNLNWLFLPGGPGLGSESLYPLTEILNVPGTRWHLDLPGDGSNTTQNNPRAFSHWRPALVEAVKALKNVILVGHSRGGMFALATPELEESLIGLVLMASAPDMVWQKDLAEKLERFPLPKADEAREVYEKNPTNDSLRECILAEAPRMFFTKKGLEEGIQFLSRLPYNHETWKWAEQHFDVTYQAQWIPRRIPTLILSGSKDIAIPIRYFAEKEEYKRSHILMKEIENAGHFPWIENPQSVIDAFNEYLSRLV